MSSYRPESAQVPVIAGFGLMILLMLGVAAIGVSHIRILSGQLTAIVAERNLKSELAASMKSLHEARYQGILLASQLNDPFDLDTQHMRYAAYARDFIQRRDRFLELPLDETEQAAWYRVREQLPGIDRLSQHIFDLLRTGHAQEARQLIKQDLKHRHDVMTQEWDRLVELQRVRNARALDEAAAASTRVRNLALALSAVALLVGIGVAVSVIRLSRRMDITLFHEREHAVVTLRALGDAVIRFDQTRRINYLNPAAEALLGIGPEHSAGNPPAAEFLRLYERESRADLTGTLLDEVLQGMNFILPPSACLLTAQGMEYEVEGKCSSIHGPDGRVIGGVLVMSDVTEARELQRKLLWHTDHDALTGLGNRYAFEARLEQSLNGKRASELSTTLLLISLGGLKQLREQVGHACSDEMLRQVAQLLSLRVRESDFPARLGEDEFAILLHACPDAKAEDIARQIADSVASFQLPWQGGGYRVEVYLGVVHLDQLTQEECLPVAYAALHAAEKKGAGSMVVHRPGGHDSVLPACP